MVVVRSKSPQVEFRTNISVQPEVERPFCGEFMSSVKDAAPKRHLVLGLINTDDSSANMIEDIWSKRALNDSVALIYYYIDGAGHLSLDTDVLYRTFLQQLMQQVSDLPDEFKWFFEDRDDNMFMYLDESKELLRMLVREFSRLYVIIDALDECQESMSLEGMLEFVDDVTSTDPHTVHTLVSSRGLEQIREHFDGRQVLQIALDEHIVIGDMRTALHTQLFCDPTYRKWPLLLKNEIQETLLKKACGS